MKTTEQFIQLLSGFHKNRGAVYGITRMGIFGSVARGETNDTSDIDIYYEGEPLSLFQIAALKEELEELVEQPVDLVRMRKSMNRLLKNSIVKDGIYV